MLLDDLSLLACHLILLPFPRNTISTAIPESCIQEATGFTGCQTSKCDEFLCFRLLSLSKFSAPLIPLRTELSKCKAAGSHVEIFQPSSLALP